MRSVAPSGSEGVLFRFSFASQQSLVLDAIFSLSSLPETLGPGPSLSIPCRPSTTLALIVSYSFLSDPETLWYWSHVSAFLWSPDERASIASLVCFIFFAGYYERDCRLKNP